MDGQPLLLLFSVYVDWHISTARRCGKPAPFLPPRPAADLIAGLLYGGIRLSPGLMPPEARFDSVRRPPITGFTAIGSCSGFRITTDSTFINTG